MTNDDERLTARNVSLSLAMRVARYPFLFAYLLIVPRLLGPADYGDLAVVISTIAIIGSFLGFGCATVFARYFPELQAGQSSLTIDQLFSGFLLLKLTSVVALAPLVFLVGSSTGTLDEYSGMYLAVLLAVLIDQLDYVLYSYLFGLNFAGLFFARYFFHTMFRFTFILILYPILGFSGALIAVVLGFLCSALFGLGMALRLRAFGLKLPQLTDFWPCLRFGLFVAVPTILLFIQQQAGPILLKFAALPPSEIAFFDLANQGFLILFGFSATGLEAFIPIVSKHRAAGRSDQSIDWLIGFLRYSLMLILLLIAFFYLFGSNLLLMLLGQAYGPVYPLALLMLFGSLPWVTGWFAYVYTVAVGQPYEYLRAMIASTVVYILVVALLVDAFGALAPAFALIASGFILPVLLMNVQRALAARIARVIARLGIASLTLLPLTMIGHAPQLAKLGAFLIASVAFLLISRGLKLWSPGEMVQLYSHLVRSKHG